MKVKWTKELINVLQTRYQIDGPTKLSQELRIPYFAVVAKARRLGIGSTRKTPPKGFVWTSEKERELQERYVSEGGENLAAEWGVNLDTVRRKASSIGLHTLAGLHAERKQRSENFTGCDIHYFDKWTPNMAYILGLLFADGSVKRRLDTVIIGLKSDDEYILEFIKKELQIRVPIKRIPANGTTTVHSTLCIHSKIAVKRMMDLGLMPMKSYNDYPFPDVPTDMLSHYIRGYLDGNGTVCESQSKNYRFCMAGFCGAPKQIEGIRDAMVKNAGVSQCKVQLRYGKTTVFAYICWSGNHDLCRIYNYLYPQGYGVCLERKRMKLDEWTAVPKRGMAKDGTYKSVTRNEL